MNRLRRAAEVLAGAVAFAAYATAAAYSDRKQKFLQGIDDESIEGYQKWYYPTVVVAGLYCWLGADEPTKALAQTLGANAYASWLALHFICPPAALIGRRIYSRDTSEQKKLGARLQLIGDGGVWAAICIYVACLINTSYWGAAIYPSFYLLMGVPGGFRFTFRSWRRLRQLKESS